MKSKSSLTTHSWDFGIVPVAAMRQWVQVVPGDAFGVIMRTNTIHTWWADFTMGKDVCDDLAGDPSTGELASGMFENALEDVVTATTTGITTSTA